MKEKEVLPMQITWFDEKTKTGLATFYKTNLTLNAVAAIPFEHAYVVRIGLSGDKNVVIRPLTKNEAESDTSGGEGIYKIACKKSYARISSTGLMSQIGAALGLELSDKPTQFESEFLEKENLLVIKTGKESKQ